MSLLDKGVHVEGDQFWKMLGANFVEPWLPDADSQNRSVIEAMTLTAAAFARGGYLPVIDFVIGPWHLDVVKDSCHLANVGCHLVVLRPSPDTTISRAAARDESSVGSAPVRDVRDRLRPHDRHVCVARHVCCHSADPPHRRACDAPGASRLVVELRSG